MKRFKLLIFLYPIFLTSCTVSAIKGATEYAVPLVKITEGTLKAVMPITDSEEYYIGRAVAAKILSSYPLLEDEDITDYVNIIGNTISMHSDKPSTYGGYHFAVLDTEEVNAFACPGGTVFLTKGIISLTRNEEELAAILAHEIAHINYRDGISSIKSARRTKALSTIGTAAIGQYGSEELSQLVNIFEESIEDIFQTLVVNGYSKSQELRADESAFTYLAKSGYKPSAILDFLKLLKAKGYSSEGGILKTHPGTSERIENVASKMPSEEIDEPSIQVRSIRHKAILNY